MTGPELVQEFNTLASQIGWKPVKKFRTLAAGQARLEKAKKELSRIQRDLTTVKETKAKRAKGNSINQDAEIQVLKGLTQKPWTKTQKRFAELEKLEKKTVKDYLKIVTGSGIGDIRWWIEGGLIKLVK
jgi:hypothetical protein